MLHIDGFEQFSGISNAAEGMTRAGYGVAGTITPVAGRTPSGRALACQNSRFSRTVPWTETGSFCTGFAFNMNDRGAVASITAGGERIILWLNPETGTPMLNDVVCGALPRKNVWYYYELTLDKITGFITLLINNKIDIEFPAPLAMFNAAEVLVELGWHDPADYNPSVTDDGSTKTYDDFYIHDGARLKPIVITTRFPSVDSSVEWFKGSSENTHAATVSKLPPDPLDSYIASDLIGARDEFLSSKLLANGNDVVATGIVVMARKSPSLDATLGVFIGGPGGAQLRQASREVEADWRTQYVCFEQIESDTKANIESSPFGLVVTP